MLILANDMNALPFPMTSSWPIAARKKLHASTGIGPFHALENANKQLTLAHQPHNVLLHKTVMWAYIILVSGMAAG